MKTISPNLKKMSRDQVIHALANKMAMDECNSFLGSRYDVLYESITRRYQDTPRLWLKFDYVELFGEPVDIK